MNNRLRRRLTELRPSLFEQRDARGEAVDEVAAADEAECAGGEAASESRGLVRREQSLNLRQQRRGEGNDGLVAAIRAAAAL